MGGGADYKIPDWKIYKVEDAPELLQVQKALASQGLRDPWLRNEVWRHNPKLFGTHWERFNALFFRGFKWGLLLAVGTLAYDKFLGSGHGHGHGHDHESEEH